MEFRIRTAPISAIVVRSHRAFGFGVLIGCSTAALAACGSAFAAASV
jgi:hypothetical protein